eukprot:7192264-Lingulodinium_polyedra.AAC.1
MRPPDRARAVAKPRATATLPRICATLAAIAGVRLAFSAHGFGGDCRCTNLGAGPPAGVLGVQA